MIKRCTCRGTKGVVTIAEIANYTLEDGYTRFILMRCIDCARVVGLPDENLTLALERGSAATLRKLETLTKLD